MGIEDLTTYTEVDPGNALVKTSSRVTVSNMTNRESDYLYKDFGAGHFDAIDLLFTFRMSASSTDGGWGVMGFANDLGDAYNWSGLIADFWIGRMAWDDCRAYLGPISYTDIDANTVYYCRMVRTAGSGTVTVYIYTDAARTVLWDTLVATGLGTTKWRYFYPISSYNDDTGGLFYGYYENFDFQRKSAGQVRVIGEIM